MRTTAAIARQLEGICRQSGMSRKDAEATVSALKAHYLDEIKLERIPKLDELQNTASSLASFLA